MKTLKSIPVMAILAVTLFSCKNSDQENIKSSVDSYTAYVDSISKMALADASVQWNEIEKTALAKKSEAGSKLETVEYKKQYDKQVESTSKKFEDFKQDVVAEQERIAATNAKQTTRNTLFKDAKIGDDLNFSWVNKDNILSVYDHFVTTAINQKASYSREQWDEIKILYEALDVRKNVVEKEGLTKADNLKIAALKLKFAPMFTVNRIVAKNEENKASKE